MICVHYLDNKMFDIIDGRCNREDREDNMEN
jgi:hypothetical protein